MEKVEWLTRSPKGRPEEMKWYYFLYSNQQRSIIFSGCASTRQILEDMRKCKGPERLDLQGLIFNKERVVKTEDNSKLVGPYRQSYDRRISRKWHYIENTYLSVRKEYSEIYNLMIKNTYPEFMRKWIH